MFAALSGPADDQWLLPSTLDDPRDASVDGEQGSFEITATGSHARIPAHAEELLAGNAPGGTIDAHAVQPVYTCMVARAAGMDIAVSIDGETVTIKAAKAA